MKNDKVDFSIMLRFLKALKVIKAFFASRAWLYEVCRGFDHDPVSARQLPKSIGCSKTFTGKNCLDTREKVCIKLNLR